MFDVHFFQSLPGKNNLVLMGLTSSQEWKKSDVVFVLK